MAQPPAHQPSFSGKDVFATKERLRCSVTRTSTGTRTFSAVHDTMLEDIVHHPEIVGKRTSYGLDGTKIMKVFWDPEKKIPEYNLGTVAGVYRKLKGKDVVFEYPITES